MESCRTTCTLFETPTHEYLHSYLKLTEVPLLLADVPALDFCLGEQRSSRRKRNGKNESSRYPLRKHKPPSEYGTYKRVKTRFWPCLSGSGNVFDMESCSATCALFEVPTHEYLHSKDGSCIKYTSEDPFVYLIQFLLCI